jgi:hypothetical protein
LQLEREVERGGGVRVPREHRERLAERDAAVDVYLLLRYVRDGSARANDPSDQQPQWTVIS